MQAITYEKFGSAATKASGEDLQFLKELIEASAVSPVIDRTYPLSETADAVRYVETGRARGKVVISIMAQATARLEERSA